MKSYKLSNITIITSFLLSCLTLQVQAKEQEDGINVSGTVRVNYAYKDYSESSKDKGGDFAFDMAAIKFNGKLGDWGLASEYRFYDGWQALRYGYGFYDVNFGTNIFVKLRIKYDYYQYEIVCILRFHAPYKHNT